jgi:hypothetical protein
VLLEDGMKKISSLAVLGLLGYYLVPTTSIADTIGVRFQLGWNNIPLRDATRI